MLALADKHGEVFASIPGLARRAGVTIEEAEKALTCLLSPDQYSRTKDFDGRRIQEIDGGWVLLNHPKYRALLSEAERREYNRVKKQESRARSLGGMSNDVNDCQQMSALSAHTDSALDSQAKEDSDELPPDPQGGVARIRNLLEQVKMDLDCPVIDAPKVNRSTRKRVAEPITDEYLSELQAKYGWVDINREFTKATTWCETNGRVCSRAFFVNWINKISQPPQVKIKQEQVYQ